MALKATVFKAQVQISDIERAYYGSHQLTLARHASETDERMMVRLLAFVLNAGDRLEFGSGLSTEDEPDLYRNALSGETECWIEVGRPSLQRIKKGCGRSQEMVIYAYGDNAVNVWWQQIAPELKRFDHLVVYKLTGTTDLEALANRTMSLQCTVDDGTVWITDGLRTVSIECIKMID